MAELKTRILVVDDDLRMRDLLVRYLGGEGHEVKAAADAAAMDKLLARPAVARFAPLALLRMRSAR